MGNNINWGLASGPNSFEQSFQRGLSTGREVKQAQQQKAARNALVAYAQDPQNQESYNALLQLDPQAAFAMRDRHRQDQEYTSNQQFKSALGDYYRGQQPAPMGAGQGLPPAIGANGSTVGIPSAPMQSGQGGAPSVDQEMPATQEGAPAPQQGMPNSAQAQKPMTSRNAAFYKMMEIDPVRAMKIDSEARDSAVKRLETVDKAYDLAISRLANVQNENEYQAVKAEFETVLAPLDMDIASHVPANWPGPEGTQRLLMSAMDAKEQISAILGRDRLNQDIADDNADNARADRNTGNMIETRNARTGISASREARIGRKGGGKKRKSKGGGQTAVDAKGNRIKWNGSAWVPVN